MAAQERVVSCPICDARIRVKAPSPGQTCNCPACGSAFQLAPSRPAARGGKRPLGNKLNSASQGTAALRNPIVIASGIGTAVLVLFLAVLLAGGGDDAQLEAAATDAQAQESQAGDSATATAARSASGSSTGTSQDAGTTPASQPPPEVLGSDTTVAQWRRASHDQRMTAAVLMVSSFDKKKGKRVADPNIVAELEAQLSWGASNGWPDSARINSFAEATYNRILAGHNLASNDEKPAAIQQTSSEPAVAAAPPAREEQKKKRTVPELIELVDPSIVRLDMSGAVGSGFVIHPSGLVATNHHVIEGSIFGKASFQDGKEYKIEGVRGYAPQYDVAILQLEMPEGESVPSLEMAEKLPSKGETVVTFGAPKGFSFTSSTGIVSAIRSGDELWENAWYRRVYARDAHWVQTTAAISGGNSGGPLINLEGRIVGLNTWTRSDGQALNFAISVAHVKRLYTECKDRSLAPLSSVPKKIVQDEPAPRDPTNWTIKLPDGEKFTVTEVMVNVNTVVGGLRASQDLMYSLYPKSDRMMALAVHDYGRLDGPVIAYYESGEPMFVGIYDDGDRDGNLVYISENGSKALAFSSYRGRLHGYALYVENSHPLYLASFSRGDMEQLHRLDPSAYPYAVVASYDADDEEGEEGQALIEKFNTNFEEFMDCERVVRKGIYDHAKERRAMNAAALSAARSRTIANRIEARAASNLGQALGGYFGASGF